MKRKLQLLGLLVGAAVHAALPQTAAAEIKLEAEIHLNDESMFFDGEKVRSVDAPNRSDRYDYYFGSALVPHGDCIKTYENFVFMTWYRGGKEDRHVMLTRYDTESGLSKTIEFPHRHVGFRGRYWIGESHNTIAIGISPSNGVIHLLYDMHAYSSDRPEDGSFAKDYFRYSYSQPGAASVSDEEFTLDQFVKSPDGDYKHLTMNGVEDESVWGALTYPKFFLNNDGELFMYMRKGGNNNGKYVFAKYDGKSTWTAPTDFNSLDAKRRGSKHNFGVYGEMKYAAGKFRVAFQRRLADNEDKYLYQNGIYYAYSDDQDGRNQWRNAQGKPFRLPLIQSDFIKIFEPGDLVETTKKNQVYMVQGFDFNVTDRGDEHFIARVDDRENNVRKNVHVWRAAGDSEFSHTTDFNGGDELYVAGNSVFMITLKDQRPFIQRTQGGTHNWETVYTGAPGREFDKGVPYIRDGKLYYYLKEPGTGDKRTTFLQIIDLGIEPS